LRCDALLWPAGAGGSIGELVRRQMVQPFKLLYSDADALRWSLHIAGALQYLHESRPAIMHRDLKLDNVLLTSPDTSVANAKVCCQAGGCLALAPHQAVWACPRTRTHHCPHLPLHAASSRTLGLLAADDEPEAPGTPCGVQQCRSSAGCELTGRTGSYGFMAPEVLQCRPYNASADIFSLGMCMFNIFARRISGFDVLLSCPGAADPLEVFAAKVGGWS
jgi:serine/threonine protein kinase